MNKGFAEVSKLIEDLGGRIDRQGIAMQQSEYLLRTEMAESAIESASTAYDIFLQDARKRKARMSTVDFARVDQSECKLPADTPCTPNSLPRCSQTPLSLE